MNSASFAIEEHEAIAVPRGSLFAKRWIPGTAKGVAPVVLFHDSIGCVEMWRQFPSALSRALGREVIAYDRLGFGRSTARFERPSFDFVTEEAGTYFPAVKVHFGLQSFIAFGHSIGGAMAIAAALSFPHDCQLIITEAAQAFVEPKTTHAIAKTGERFRHPEELGKIARYHGKRAEWVVRSWVVTWLSPEWASWTLKSSLTRVRCPLLVLHGERDEYGSTAFPDELASQAGGLSQKVIIKDCAHVPHREQEQFVLDLVEDFISSRCIP